MRKCLQFAGAGAPLTVIAPEAMSDITHIPNLVWHQREAHSRDIAAPFQLVILATNNPEVQATFAALCRERTIWYNRCDEQADSDFVTGSLVEAGPFLLGLTSSGSPAVTKLLRHHLEKAITPEIRDLAELLQEVRPLVKTRFANQNERESFFRTWATDEVLERIRRGGIAEIRREVMACLSC